MSKTYSLAIPPHEAEALQRVLSEEIAAVINDPTRCRQAIVISRLADSKVRLAALQILSSVKAQKLKDAMPTIRLLEQELPHVE